MDILCATINELMIEVFNDILKIEEITLKSGVFSDVSVTEVHTIDAIGLYTKQTMGEIAKKLNITLGTLTVAIKNLVNKGYVERFNSIDDKRVVKISLTKKGRVLFRVHQKFHKDMLNESMAGLANSEIEVLANSFSKLHNFLSNKYKFNLK